MSSVTGADLLVASLKRRGVDTLFLLMGGPLESTVNGCAKQGMRLVDTRHEQGAAMMAHGYARASGRPGVCMVSAGPGTTNATTGILNAFLDCSPVVVVGGSVALSLRGMEAFQETDQLGVMKPITKAAWQIPCAERVPAYVSAAFRTAMTGRQGPIYLDFPADVLYGEVGSDVGDKALALSMTEETGIPAPAGDPAAVRRAMELLRHARRPIILSGSGSLWADAGEEMRQLVERLQIPFYTTPLGRGILPEDHPLSLLSARTVAFREADLVLILGTRSNFISSYLLPPRLSEKARIIMVNIDPQEIGHNRPVDVGIVGDVKQVLRQMLDETKHALPEGQTASWVEQLREADAERERQRWSKVNLNQVPIHHLRVCEELRAVLPRDAVLAVDGRETLNTARQTIPSYYPRHRLNPGLSGCMGIGVPFGIAAKVAKPDKTVVVLTGDGSFGMTAMELNTAVRHKIPLAVIICNNGGWTADTGKWLAARNLGHTAYHVVAQGLGCEGEQVDRPEDLKAALGRAMRAAREGTKPYVVNVIVDPKIRAPVSTGGSFGQPEPRAPETQV